MKLPIDETHVDALADILNYNIYELLINAILKQCIGMINHLSHVNLLCKNCGKDKK